MSKLDVKRGMRRFYGGMALAVVSVLCQVLNEMFCSKNEFMKRFPGHAIWHVGMACALQLSRARTQPSPPPLHHRPHHSNRARAGSQARCHSRYVEDPRRAT